MITKKISSKILKIVTASAFMSVNIVGGTDASDAGRAVGPFVPGPAPIAEFAQPRAADLQELLRIINILEKPSKSFIERYGFVDRLFHLPFDLVQNSIYGIGLFLRAVILPPGENDENWNTTTKKNPDYVRFLINKNPQYVKVFNALIWVVILLLLSGLTYNIFSNCGWSGAQAVVFAKGSWIFVVMFGLHLLTVVYTGISLLIEYADSPFLRQFNPYHDLYNTDIAQANIKDNQDIFSALKDPIQRYYVDGNKDSLLCKIAVIIHHIITNSTPTLIADISDIIHRNNFGLDSAVNNKQIAINFIILVSCSVLAIEKQNRGEEHHKLDQSDKIKASLIALFPGKEKCATVPPELQWFYNNLKLKHYMIEVVALGVVQTTVKEIIKSLDDIKLQQATNSLGKIKNMNILISLLRSPPLVIATLIGWAQKKFSKQPDNFGFQHQQNQLAEWSIWFSTACLVLMFLIFMTTPQFIAFREYMEGLCSLKVLIACCKSYWVRSLIFGFWGIALIVFLVVFIIYALDMRYRNKSACALQRINKDSDPAAIIKEYCQSKIYAEGNDGQINDLNNELHYNIAAYFYHHQNLDDKTIEKIIKQIHVINNPTFQQLLEVAKDVGKLEIGSITVDSANLPLIHQSLIGWKTNEDKSADRAALIDTLRGGRSQASQ